MDRPGQGRGGVEKICCALAAINLGNPVLAQGTAAAPSGVSVEIARELGVRLGVRVELIGCGAAQESLAALVRGGADICFLAIEPARAAEVAFTAPYVVIEGVYVVREDSGLTALADIDRAHRGERGVGV